MRRRNTTGNSQWHPGGKGAAGGGLLAGGWFGWVGVGGGGWGGFVGVGGCGELVDIFLGDFGDGDDLISFGQGHDADTLRVSADGTDLAGPRSDDHPLLGDEHDFVVVSDARDGDDVAVTFGGFDVDEPFAAAILGAVLFEEGSLAVAVLTDGEEGSLGIDYDTADDFIAFGEVDSLNALRVSAHLSGLGFAEPDGHPFLGGQDDVVGFFDEHAGDEGVSLVEVDADDAAFLGSAVGGESGFLGESSTGDHEDASVVELASDDVAGDSFVGAEFEEIDDGASLAGARHGGYVIDLEPIALSHVGEEEDVGVGAGDEDVGEEVPFSGLSAGDSLAASSLGAIGVEWESLDVAFMADGDDGQLVGDEGFHVEVAVMLFDERAPGVAELFGDMAHVFADDGADVVVAGEDSFVLGDLVAEFLVLFEEFVLFERGEALKLHLKDLVGLGSGEVIAVLHAHDFLEGGKAVGAESAFEEGGGDL